MEESGRSRVICTGGVSIPAAVQARRSLCAHLVRSGSSQLEHLKLEPDPLKKAEMMRSSSRRSLDLSRKGARTIADKRTNIGTAGARRAVTSAVREGQAHGMEQHGHGVR